MATSLSFHPREPAARTCGGCRFPEVSEALTTGAGDDLDPVVTPDGRAVLFTNVKRTWALVVHDPNSGVRKTLLEKRTHLAFCPMHDPAIASRSSGKRARIRICS